MVLSHKEVKVMFGNSFCFLFSKTCFGEYEEKTIFLYFLNQKHVWLAEIKKDSCGRVSHLGPQLAGIIRFGSCFMDLFNPTSGRDASHMCM